MDESFKLSGTSPWADQVELLSPDKKYKAIFADGIEIGMGAPTMGTLMLYSENKKVLSVDCTGASFLWSDDSQFFAYTKWTKTNQQIINILKIDDMIARTIEQEMSVVKFESFKNKILKGIDSPIYFPKHFSIDVNLLFK